MSTAAGMGLISGQGTKTKIPHAKKEKKKKHTGPEARLPRIKSGFTT